MSVESSLESLRRRARRTRADGAPATLSELLIISDLHLGGPLRPTPTGDPDAPGPVGFGALRQVVRLDRALARFIDHHRVHGPRSGGPWTLVFAGDTVDFLHMDLRPDGEDAPAPDGDEQLYGLSFEAHRAVWKMKVIAAYHRHTFRALARFAEAGHRVVLVVGNHDVDLWFTDVRRTFVEQVAAYADDPQRVRDALRFEPWFFYEPGRVYIEHGHRFDPFATFPDPLAPLATDRARHLAPNFGHFGLRYFANRVRSFPIHDLDQQGLADLWRWIKRHSPLYVARAAWQMVAFLWHYGRATARDRFSRRRREAATRARRRARLRKFAARYGMPLGRILALDNLRRPHIGQSLFRLAHGLMLDRVVLVALLVIGLLFGFSADDAQTGTWTVVGVLGGTALLWWRLDRSRPSADVHPLLGRMARRVGRLSGAPVVVFGHTHRPVLRRMGRTRWLNPGAWEHVPRHRPHAADEPCDCPARYGVIDGPAERPLAHLQRWCIRRGAPHVVEEQA